MENNAWSVDTDNGNISVSVSDGLDVVLEVGGVSYALRPGKARSLAAAISEAIADAAYRRHRMDQEK